MLPEHEARRADHLSQPRGVFDWLLLALFVLVAILALADALNPTISLWAGH
jgi:hypothetical protein